MYIFTEVIAKLKPGCRFLEQSVVSDLEIYDPAPPWSFYLKFYFRDGIL